MLRPYKAGKQVAWLAMRTKPQPAKQYFLWWARLKYASCCLIQQFVAYGIHQQAGNGFGVHLLFHRLAYGFYGAWA